MWATIIRRLNDHVTVRLQVTVTRDKNLCYVAKCVATKENGR